MVKILMIIFFTASWCHYCRIMEPIVLQLQQSYDIEIVKDDPETNKKYGVTRFPTLWVDGKKHEGLRTIDQYQEYME